MELRPYQNQAIANLRSSLAQGKVRPVLQAATGAGKTVMASTIIQSAVDKGNRVLFIVDNLELVEQAIQTFESIGLKVGVMQGIHEKTDSMHKVQVCTAQTLAARIKNKPAMWGPENYQIGLIIHDECFPAKTLISTPSGEKEIQDIRCGDVVHNAVGAGVVTATNETRKNKILKLRLSNGKSIRCTENHPFFTSSGWVEASELESGARLYCQQEMQELWRCDEAENVHDERTRVCERIGETLERKRDMLNILRKEIEKPDAEQANSRQSQQDIEEDRTQAAAAGRQWQASNKTSDYAALTPRAELGDGICGCDQDKMVHGDAYATALQNRFSELRSKAGHRDRRWLAWDEIATGARQAEGRIFGGIRVESIEAYESSNAESVFNLQVSGHPSYFAENVLVHNCHVQWRSRDMLAELYPDVPVVGLSATPYAKGMGKFYDDLVVAIPMQELIQTGFLSPFRVFAPSKPDMSGVATKSNGDWQESGAAERYTPTIIADVVRTWLKHGRGRSTIGFACNVAHSKLLAEEFQKSGINAVHIDGYGGDDESKEHRRSVIEKFKAGEIDILWNVGIATKGFDAPRVSCIIDARPTKSLMLHIQKWGRGLRTFEGKEDCIILDHAGNTERNGFPTDLMPDELDDGTKGNAQSMDRKKKDDPLPKPCPACSFMKPAGVHKCSACGFAPEKRANVENVDGELVEVGGKKYSKKQRERWFADLLHIAYVKGYKQGWAFHKFREKFGSNPPKGVGVSTEISPEVESYVKHLNIRYAQGKKKREKARAA